MPHRVTWYGHIAQLWTKILRYRDTWNLKCNTAKAGIYNCDTATLRIYSETEVIRRTQRNNLSRIAYNDIEASFTG